MLKENIVKKYWETRATEHGARAVGYKNRPLDQQKIEHERKSKFIFSHCLTKLKTLDYGCGVGNFASEFEKYLGVDIIKEFIDIAKNLHPNKNFRLLKQPYLDGKLGFKPELFFTVTVLQHNSDELIDKILASLARLSRKPFHFCLYENAQTNCFHVKARAPEDYKNMIAKYFNVTYFKFHRDISYKEKHDLTLIGVDPK